MNVDPEFAKWAKLTRFAAMTQGDYIRAGPLARVACLVGFGAAGLWVSLLLIGETYHDDVGLVECCSATHRSIASHCADIPRAVDGSRLSDD